jgi:hypothetical protein
VQIPGKCANGRPRVRAGWCYGDADGCCGSPMAHIGQSVGARDGTSFHGAKSKAQGTLAGDN